MPQANDPAVHEKDHVRAAAYLELRRHAVLSGELRRFGREDVLVKQVQLIVIAVTMDEPSMSRAASAVALAAAIDSRKNE